MDFFASMSKRSRSKSKGYKKARPTSAKAAKKLASQKSSLKAAKMAAVRQLANVATAGFLGIEKKFLDTFKGSTSIVSSATLATGMYDPAAAGGCEGCLSCPSEGDSEQQRDGKKYVIDSLILKGEVNLDKSASVAAFDSVKVFVAVVLDTQTNGAQMSAADCFKNISATADTIVDPMKNLLSGNRFRILKSQVYDLTPLGVGPAGALAYMGTRRDFDWYIPFKGGLQVNLKIGDLNSGKNADVANVVDNSLHVVAFATLAGAEIAYNARIRFQG